MQVECNKCQRGYHASCRFGQERLWRLTCPHCGAATWVSAPATDSSPSRQASNTHAPVVPLRRVVL
ncbi:MAG: hypothetical protein JST54_10295 [Deltaproteobacteria bacterium]|nr:hypothetical protein [Deltaproteobacteria bacterium]